MTDCVRNVFAWRNSAFDSSGFVIKKKSVFKKVILKTLKYRKPPFSESGGAEIWLNEKALEVVFFLNRKCNH